MNLKTDYKRKNDRLLDQLRPILIERDFVTSAHSSVLITFGKTKVLCTATIENKSPIWLKNSNQGWVTAEYSMLPGSSNHRVQREAVKGRQSGRTMEIQRLIGRSLRASVDLSKLQEKTITIDCDVLEADGGTRTASITAGCLALFDAILKNEKKEILKVSDFGCFVGAVSVGVINGATILDLNYQEDSSCDVDLNVVMNEDSQFIEIQGTAERGAFSHNLLDEMLNKARIGINQLIILQKKFIDNPSLKIVKSDD